MSTRTPTFCLRVRAALWEERGQSLFEVLIAALVTVIVLGSIGALLIASQRDQQKNASYDAAQGSAQTELDAMVTQIGAANNIIAASPNSVDMDVSIGGTDVQVYYECDIPIANGDRSCVRLQTGVTDPLPPLSTATTVIPDITNGTTAAPVFSWTSEAPAPTYGTGTTTTPVPVTPDYVTATIDVPAADGVASPALTLNHTIAFSDGALIRNVIVQNN
ncbi:hypothetical protein [Conexibacter sp. DBS9H8]|uniref:type IV pilus modification PilV family protein n=1 Tax=Conexibacter sp. DBS9H8 TaxID=2937801 RepID=UPI00200C80CB|nr:hypothetical protein [Conexibacter sp. DBS9H8]